MAKFSLLLYVHNAQKFLPQCLNSLLKQSEKDFELLIFDNASTDGSFQTLELYQKRDKRIKIFFEKQEKCVAEIKNILLSKAKAEIVTFLSLAEFKDSFLQYAGNKINALSYDVLILRSNKEYLTFPRCADGLYSDKTNKSELFCCNLPVPENIFYRHEFLKQTKAKFSKCEFGSDFAFYIETIAKAQKVCYVNKNLLLKKADFYEFTQRELANYRQFADVVSVGVEILKKCNLWQSSEKYYIEALHNYLKIMIKRLPYPVKNFFQSFIANDLTQQMNPLKFDCKNYILPVVADFFYQLQRKIYPSAEFEKAFFSQKCDITAVVLAVDSNKDATITDVLLQSIISNACQNKFYDIYILSRGDISNHVRETIEKETAENICVTFIDVTKFIPDNAYTYLYKTSSLYFFIPDILEQYGNVIYLKNNVLVLKDVALFNAFDVKNIPISGVSGYENNEYIENDLKLISETYIDDSVLFFNIPLCKKMNLSQKFLHLISSETKIDKAQDILNTICFNKINVIAPKYNCKIDLLSGKRLIMDYPYKINDVAVLNYENELPSSNYFCEFSDIWWKYARNSAFYELISRVEKHNISDREYLLMRLYIKETFLKIFTFGETSKKHKENITKLQILMAEEQKV